MQSAFRVGNRAGAISFELVADDEGSLLKSREFASLDEALLGIADLRKNAAARNRFRALHTAGGDCFFEFLGHDGQPLATSRTFPSFASLLQGEVRVAAHYGAPIVSAEPD